MVDYSSKSSEYSVGILVTVNKFIDENENIEHCGRQRVPFVNGT